MRVPPLFLPAARPIMSASPREICLEAAKLGGQALLEWRDRFQAREKGPRDLVTQADLAAQEAIRNAARHSGARCVDLSVSRHEKLWELVVDDDGQGMAAGRVEARREEGHLGLHALGQLLADAGGSLSVHSAPNAGTRVEMRVPAS